MKLKQQLPTTVNVNTKQLLLLLFRLEFEKKNVTSINKTYRKN